MKVIARRGSILRVSLPLLAAVLVALTSCRGDAVSEAGSCPSGSGSDRSSLTVLDPNYEMIFNPSWSTWGRFLVFSPLVWVDEEGAIEPRLARSWEHSENYRAWTFHLRTDVRWHDGEPFDARDVAFTERIMGHPDVGYRAHLTDTVVVVNDSTVTIRRTRPWHVRDLAWWVYYPEHLLGDVARTDFFDAEFWSRPVGTGPYRYVRHVPRTVFVLEANPDHYRGEPAIERVRIKFGGGQPVAEMKSGNVDVATYVSRAEVPMFREDPCFRLLYQLQGPDGEAILWNQDHALLSDTRVRRALTMAIDRRELYRLGHLPRRLPRFPDGFPLFDVFPTRRFLSAGELPPPLPHDPDSARTLLTAAGWRDADGDGVREKGGEPARFTALVGGGGTDATVAGRQAAVYVQAALAELGVQMRIEQLEAGFGDRVRMGEFEAAFDDPGPHARYFGEDSPFGYHEPTLARIFGSLDTVVDRERRDSLWRESWPILRRDVPLTFLGPKVQIFVAHRKVKGLESPFRAHPYVHLWQAELEEGNE